MLRYACGTWMSIIFNLRFPGQYYDKDSGQYYNHNRYYNPELGRYMGLANGVSFGLAQPISNLAFGYQTANVNSGWYVSGELTSMLTGGAAVGRGATQTAMRNADNAINSLGIVLPEFSITNAGRAKNKIEPLSDAIGNHTTFKYGTNGQISNYATHTTNLKNPSGFQEIKRVDLIGRPHRNPDGTIVPTPHVKEIGLKGVRPAKRNELP